MKRFRGLLKSEDAAGQVLKVAVRELLINLDSFPLTSIIGM